MFPDPKKTLFSLLHMLTNFYTFYKTDTFTSRHRPARECVTKSTNFKRHSTTETDKRNKSSSVLFDPEMNSEAH